jgi:phosphoserine phosphatase
MKVAVDIDDTLYSFSQLAREIFSEMAIERGDKRMQRGAYCYWGEWRTPTDMSDPETFMEVIDRCHTNSNIMAQTPFRGAAETLKELKEQGYELLYISGGRRKLRQPPSHGWGSTASR